MARGDYHHGDLRRVLVDTAWSRVARNGIEGLSLRGIAREAGVSHAAPYHHFEGREALLAAVATSGFQRMRESMERAADDTTTQGNPLEQLQAVGIAYVQFAVEHPEIFRLMFSGMLSDRGRFEGLQDAADATWDVLAGGLAARSERADAVGLPVVALAAWSTVHGLAFLLIENLLDDEVDSLGVEEISYQVTLALGRGLKYYGQPPEGN